MRLLAARADVAELVPVRDAFTPVVKFALGGVQVDLLFCALAPPAGGGGGASLAHGERHAASLDVLDDTVLRGLDEAAVRSLNGARVGGRSTLALQLMADLACSLELAGGDPQPGSRLVHGVPCQQREHVEQHEVEQRRAERRRRRLRTRKRAVASSNEPPLAFLSAGSAW